MIDIEEALLNHQVQMERINSRPETTTIVLFAIAQQLKRIADSLEAKVKVEAAGA